MSELKPGCCAQCGLPLVDNPHPDAGKPERYLEVGVPKECLPCLVLSRHQWAGRAMAAEREIREAKQSSGEPPEGLTDAWLMEQWQRNTLVCDGKAATEVLRAFAFRVLQEFGDYEGMHKAMDDWYRNNRNQQGNDKIA